MEHLDKQYINTPFYGLRKLLPLLLAQGYHINPKRLEQTIASQGKPEIINSDQGSQFTSAQYVNLLTEKGIQISMDGKGRFKDNIFLERLWGSVK